MDDLGILEEMAHANSMRRCILGEFVVCAAWMGLGILGVIVAIWILACP